MTTPTIAEPFSSLYAELTVGNNTASNELLYRTNTFGYNYGATTPASTSFTINVGKLRIPRNFRKGILVDLKSTFGKVIYSSSISATDLSK